MRVLILGALVGLVVIMRAVPAPAQNGEEAIGEAEGAIDRSSDTAEGIDRVGNLGVGIADTNPNRNVTGGGAPCGTSDICDLGTTTPPGTPLGGGGASQGAPTTTDAPPPPPPPTHREIIATICPPAPTPTIGHNPHDYGITGFHTWLWSQGPHTATANGTIRSHPVTCTLTAEQFTFDTHDPHATTYGHPSTYTTTDPGHEDDTTDVQHFWEVKGTYPLTLDITWDRTTTAGTDTTTSTATRPLQVKEIRAGMTTPDA